MRSEDSLTRNSYYEASADRTDRYPALQDEVACDVCVVGAGLAGLSAPIDRSALPAGIASRRYQGAAYDAGSGHLHPLKYTLGLARAASTLGVKIFEGSEAIEVKPGQPAVVRTAQGRVHCSHVLLAGNV